MGAGKELTVNGRPRRLRDREAISAASKKQKCLKRNDKKGTLVSGET